MNTVLYASAFLQLLLAFAGVVFWFTDIGTYGLGSVAGAFICAAAYGVLSFLSALIILFRYSET